MAPSRSLLTAALRAGVALFAIGVALVPAAAGAHENPFPPPPNQPAVEPIIGGEVVKVASSATDADSRHNVVDALGAAGFVDVVDKGDGKFYVAIGDLTFDDAEARLLNIAGVDSVSAKSDGVDVVTIAVVAGAAALVGGAGAGLLLTRGRRTRSTDAS
jgi:hypothetical protein